MDIQIMGAYRRMYEQPDAVMDFVAFHAYVLVHFPNPMRITINGVEQITERDAWVFYTPDCRQQFSLYKGEFINDYIWAKIYNTKILENLNFPFNEVFYLDSSDEPLECINYITWMLTDVLNDHSDGLEEQYKKCLDCLNDHIIQMSPKFKRDSISRRMFAELRESMRESPTDWTVDKLAKSVYLTRSHFSVQYANMFGISPGEDLRKFVMEKAEQLLLETNLTVTEIAEQLGYSNAENFIRSFKKYSGMTPNKFRN